MSFMRDEDTCDTYKCTSCQLSMKYSTPGVHVYAIHYRCEISALAISAYALQFIDCLSLKHDLFSPQN